MQAISNPYGMVLVTGPTGSGKTTTLYSALSKINNIDVNIMTAEDPVEYNLFGINQVLVRTDIGMTFAAALKAFLRQDPNIIMLGEIRDLETGGIAIKAALTGHLVLSTLHTNSAPETVTRLMDMGIEPFNVASALNLILAQRLVRRVCSKCAEAYKMDKAEIAGAKIGGGVTLRDLHFTDMALNDAKDPGYRRGQAVHGPDHARHQDGRPPDLSRKGMRAVRWFRPQGTARNLRSHEHDAQTQKADHAERGRRRNSESRHRRGNAHTPHGWLAESAQGDHSSRSGSPRNRSVISNSRIDI